METSRQATLRLVRRLARLLRDGSGSSTLVERFDVLSALLDARSRGVLPQLDLDPAALAEIQEAMDDTPVALGPAYEELLRHTFDKSDHQQFFTPRTLVDFMVQLVRPWLVPGAVLCDPAIGTGGFCVQAVAREPGLVVRGYEVDARLAAAARLNLRLAGAEDADIRHLPGAGTLGPLSGVQAGVDVVLTNPPFGSDLMGSPLEGLQLGRGRSSRRRSLLFVERCLDLLGPGGVLAMILDESALAGGKSHDVRAHLRRRARLLAVVGLPEVAFQPYANVRSSVLLAVKRPVAGDEPPVFFARAAQVGRRGNGATLLKPEGERLVPDDDLPDVLGAWQRHVLGLDLGRAERATWFAAPLSAVDLGQRLDFAFHEPSRRVAERTLAQAACPVRRLDQLARMVSERVTPARDMPDELITWVSLSDIEAGSGRCIPQRVPAEQVRSQSVRFQKGDLLFARLRPELRKVWLATVDGICSAECLIFRPRPEAGMDPVLLCALLRSDLVYGQLVHQVTGIGRPRVSRGAVRALRLPVPSSQDRLVAGLAEAERRAADHEERARRERLAADQARRGALGELLEEVLR